MRAANLVIRRDAQRPVSREEAADGDDRGLLKRRPSRQRGLRAYVALGILLALCGRALFPEYACLAALARAGLTIHDVRYQWADPLANITVAIVGGGLAGLSAAHAFIESNRRTRSVGKEVNAQVTIFEASPRIGGHSWTYDFPLANGSTYPVDLAYAYNPTMASYEPIRRFERKYGISAHLLRQSISVLREGQPIPADEAVAFDKHCDVWMGMVRWVVEHPLLARVYYGTRSLRSVLAWSGLSLDFFTYRLYPVVRFVIVSGSKGKLLDASALGAMASYTSGWASCYGHELHGKFDCAWPPPRRPRPSGALPLSLRTHHCPCVAGCWAGYSVRGGSERHIDVFKHIIPKEHIRTSTPVTAVRRAPQGGFDVRVRPDSSGGPDEVHHFDAVIMACPPDDAHRILGGSAPDSIAPGWLGLPTTEETEVVLHADVDAVVVPSARAVLNYRLNATSDPSGAALSVLWAEMHGESAVPEPILSTGDMRLYGEKHVQPFRGEVIRTAFKHVHLPSIYTYLRVSQGRVLSSWWAPLEFAGAWVNFGMGHPDALNSGLAAAERLGASVTWSTYYRYGERYKDPDGYEQRMRDTDGRVV